MSSRTMQRGVLYVVATPIGNLGDLTDRAREVLGRVAVVAAEDTRHSGQMLKQLGIAKSLVSLHEHNEAQRAKALVERIVHGDDVALISDAGTPLISDPGFDLVRAALESGVEIVPIPGACAAIAALSVSGLATDRFRFEGFLSPKSGARRERLQGAATHPETLIFYEAPHRLQNTLTAMVDALGGERRAVVARELTKQFETIYRGTLSELALRCERDPDMSRGEAVVLVAGAVAESSRTPLDVDEVLRVLLEELPPAQAAKLAARLLHGKRAELYDRAIALAKKAR